MDGHDGKKLPVWGINGIWPIGTPLENHHVENIEGFHWQIAYPSIPYSPAIALYRPWEITLDAMKRFCFLPKTERNIPSPTFNAYSIAKEDEDWSYAVKPVYSLTKDGEPRCYIKLMTKPG